MISTVTLAAVIVVCAFAAALVVLAFCKAANDRLNPKQKEYDDYED